MPEKPEKQWERWLNALPDADFEVEIMEPAVIKSRALQAGPGDALLLDGMLPRLSQLITNACLGSPEAEVIVATPIDSFTIKYEVLLTGGAIYVSGPMTSNQFAETIHGILEEHRVGIAC